MATVRTDLPSGTLAVPVARHFTTEALSAWAVPDEIVEIAELVVSELVGNAVEHADGVAELRVGIDEEVLWLAVSDHDRDLPTVSYPTPEEDRHRGLLLVSKLSSRWGTRRGDGGKVVWAELDCPAAAGGIQIIESESLDGANKAPDDLPLSG